MIFVRDRRTISEPIFSSRDYCRDFGFLDTPSGFRNPDLGSTMANKVV